MFTKGSSVHYGTNLHDIKKQLSFLIFYIILIALLQTFLISQNIDSFPQLWLPCWIILTDIPHFYLRKVLTFLVNMLLPQVMFNWWFLLIPKFFLSYSYINALHLTSWTITGLLCLFFSTLLPLFWWLLQTSLVMIFKVIAQTVLTNVIGSVDLPEET